MSDSDPRDDVPDSDADAERAGVVDHKDAARAAIDELEAGADDESGEDPMAGEAPTG